MSGEAIQQVLDTSVDPVGLSIVSSTMTAEDPRCGSMYYPETLAAGVPVWFHALQDGRWVALFRSHWSSATVGTGGPQSYTDHSEAGSCWVRVAPPTGGMTVPIAITTGVVPGELVLNGACSRGDFLYTIGNMDGSGIIQHHRISAEGLLLLAGEELMFPVGSVVFDRGCFIDGAYLVIFGADADDNLYMARRDRARIGQTDQTPGYTWEYRSAKGWLTDITALEPIGVKSVGPVSVAKFKDRLLVSAVFYDPAAAPAIGNYMAQVYQARQSDPFGRWKRLGDPIFLGDTDTYLGGGLYLQSQLGRNPAMPMPAGAVAAIPYVHSARAAADGEESIYTTWGLWPVRATV